MIKKRDVVPGAILNVKKASKALALDAYKDLHAVPLNVDDHVIVLTKPRQKDGIELVRVKHGNREGELYYCFVSWNCDRVGFDQATADGVPPEKPKRKPREMPKTGFYTYADGSRIVYCTGTRTGNKYYDVGYHSEWCDLLWTCVPGKAEINSEYTYSETQPENTPEMK